RIGLRTLELDTARDEWGRNFRFVINGVPIFAKGANWIPSDSFIGRTTPEDLRYLLHSARETNMNMVRVWGGGYYGSDDFYDLCDELGLLVWQDFAFACSPYPLYDPQFRESVRCEVVDNVRRLRHHPSLALWCGSNEIDMMAMLWKRHKKIHRATREFFHDILPRWVGEEDAVTPYWPGSPSSGINRPKPNALHEGDTHLWQVWHGLMPIELFGKMPTRFCSEFGMESLPSRNAIAQFSADEDLSLFDPVMLAHQKSAGGNQKMLFYLLAKYRKPTSLDDFIYLSQIVQSETIREATEGWKRRIGRCNGALYWQLNDCWPVASWAGIDYSKTWKAVFYRSASVYRMISANLTREGGRVAIYLVNEYPDLRTLDCEYRIMT
ncbi:MAG: glycoside hydrolase family 2 protein, partial [Spirochaetales bacterium]|nr:glycoside hydrolase family 2 protein [Spirochaetales bacterium]